MLGNFSCVSSSADFFFSNHLLEKNISGIQSVSDSLDPDQIRHFVGPYLGSNYLQRLSADHTSESRVNVGLDFGKVNYHAHVLLDIFQLHITLRFVRQRRLTLDSI